MRLKPALKIKLTAKARHAAMLMAIAVSAAGFGPAAQAADFSFGVIGQAFSNNKSDPAAAENALRGALAESDADNLAFVVVNGIKTAAEPCTDQLYMQRRDILNAAQNGIIMSLAASDWVACRNKAGKSTAIERLNQIRELFYDGEMSFGASKLDLMRQSATPKFREYEENARWEFGEVLFATINLPADNNHYRSDGGRNSDYEDRLIATRDWLRHLFAIAKNKKLPGIVLFTDANPLLPPAQRTAELRGQRDGFSEVRQQLGALASKYPGRVLLVHGQRHTGVGAGGQNIVWTGNLGVLASDAGWSKISVDPARPMLFTAIDHKETVQMSRR